MQKWPVIHNAMALHPFLRIQRRHACAVERIKRQNLLLCLGELTSSFTPVHGSLTSLDARTWFDGKHHRATPTPRKTSPTAGRIRLKQGYLGHVQIQGYLGHVQIANALAKTPITTPIMPTIAFAIHCDFDRVRSGALPAALRASSMCISTG